MSRSRFVYINGTSYPVQPDGTIEVAGETWCFFGGEWVPEASIGSGVGVMVMPDIKPYQSVIDGSLISSRSVHRAHLRAHGCIEVGNEKLPEKKYDFTPKGLRADLIRSYDELARRR